MEIEILLSTQNKTNLDFLKSMFVNASLSDVKLLVVNQTVKGKELTSSLENVRVINSYEKGSPSSRNLAIKNAKGNICLFADDDIIYFKDFTNTILEAYRNNPSAEVITFEAVDNDDIRYMKYANEGEYTGKTFYVNTYVISFKREAVQSTSTLFNPYFGVGSVFPGSTEFFFMKNAFDNGLKMYHKQTFIVKHPNVSSGKKQGSDNAVFSKTARHYHLMGNKSVLWLVKYILFLIRHKYIKLSEAFDKFKVGLSAIKTYKQLVKAGKIS